MKHNRIAVVLLVLILTQLACNRPNSSGTQIPAPNQTLTALFAFTPAGTSTSTLPPVVTATQPAAANPTATQQAAPTQQPAATQAQSNPTAAAPTAAVQPSATVPGVRPRGAVVAKFLSTPPNLDGDWSEWKDLTTEYPATNVVYGRESWANEDDLAASFHIGWDNNNLYVAVKVRDDRYVQNASGENLFKGDSLELLVDTKLQDDFFYNRLSPDDFQLGIGPGRPDPSGTREAFLWLPTNVAGVRSGVQIASLLEAGQYRVEVAIPWNVLEMTPAEGRHYGFALSVSDNDDTSQSVQQTMVSNITGRSLTDPTTWGDLLLSR